MSNNRILAEALTLLSYARDLDDFISNGQGLPTAHSAYHKRLIAVLRRIDEPISRAGSDEVRK